MALITRDISKGQLVAFVFGQDAVAASQSDVQLPALSAEEGGIVDGYAMAFPYEVVGISASLSAAGSAGTLAVGATINGTEPAAGTLTVTTETNAYRAIQRGRVRGAAGSRLGCELTTNAGWNGTSADLIVTVWCLVSLEDI